MFNMDFDGIRKEIAAKDREVQKLKMSYVPIDLKKGDTVVVMAGLIGRGYNHIRKAATVLLVGRDSAQVKWHDQCEWAGSSDEINETWIDLALVVDHFPASPAIVDVLPEDIGK